MPVISMNFPARKEDRSEDHSLRVDSTLSLPTSINLIPFLTPSHKTPLLLPLVIYICLLCKFMITFDLCFMMGKAHMWGDIPKPKCRVPLISHPIILAPNFEKAHTLELYHKWQILPTNYLVIILQAFLGVWVHHFVQNIFRIWEFNDLAWVNSTCLYTLLSEAL
jgi:hypothetical protein